MYQAIIARIKVVKHPQADRLQLGNVLGTQVIVGMDTTNNELGIYFPCDGQLSSVFAEKNDLIVRKDPTTGEKIGGGLFDHKRRIRVQKLRGEKSEGYFSPLNALLTAGVSEKTVLSLKEGDKFTDLDGIPICNKYISDATRRLSRGPNKIKTTKKKNPRFPEHFETAQFRHEAGNIQPGDILWLSCKSHGTSARYAYIQEEVQYNKWWQKLLNKVNLYPKSSLEWTRLIGTRRVVLASPDHIGFYGTEQFRYDVCKDWLHLLKKGEIVYGEIVGWIDSDRPIMPAVDTRSIKDKEFSKFYGPKMVYKYGCPAGTRCFLVYRIAQVNEDGYLVDLSWAQVVKRCEELGLKTVHLFTGPIIFKDLEQLEQILKPLVDGPDPLDSSHVREGVCVRIEGKNGVNILKEKSWYFKVLEQIIKDNSDSIDIEEAQDINN